MRHGIYLLAVLMLLAATARADVVVVPATRDNTLFQDANGLLSSGAGTGIFAGNNSQSLVRRAVVYFDLTAAIAGPATIDSVELRLNVESAPNTTPQVITIHRALASWGEGTSSSTGGSGAPASTSDATWLHRFYPDTFWSTPGGDFDAAPHAAALVGAIGLHVWKGAALAQDVSDWLASPSTNFGWLVRGPENVASTVRRFDSRETANVPQLVIHYTPLPTPTRAVTWGQIKALFRF
jgi:hypothetical protein